MEMADEKTVAKSALSNNSVQPKSIDDFDPPAKSRRNKYTMACAALASAPSVLLGYDTGVMSGAIIYIKDDLKITNVEMEILTGIFAVYSLLGSVVAGRTSDWIGRRNTIMLAGAIFFTGALLMGFAPNYVFLMFGRFATGIGVGYALAIAPVYIAEVSPTISRGFLTSFPEVFINIGILLGYISNYAFSKLRLNLGWRMMLGVGAIPSVLLTFGVLTLPESPRWLIMQDRLGDAKRVLARTSNSKEEATLRLADIKEAANIPKECYDDVVKFIKRSIGKRVWRDLLLHPTPSVRHILICAIGLNFFQQASGINAVVLYSPHIFAKVGITSFDIATIAVGFVKTMFILVATFLLDRVGRRPLLLSSIGGMIFSLASLGTCLTIINHSNTKPMWAMVMCVASVLSYVAFFSIGKGPITWVYSSEIFPLRLRAQGCAIGVAVNGVTNGVLSMTFLSLYNAITIGGAFFLFMAITCAAWLFFYMIMPETQGRTLEEMGPLFGKYTKWRSVAREIDIQRNKAAINGDRGGGEGQLGK